MIRMCHFLYQQHFGYSSFRWVPYATQVMFFSLLLHDFSQGLICVFRPGKYPHHSSLLKKPIRVALSSAGVAKALSHDGRSFQWRSRHSLNFSKIQYFYGYRLANWYTGWSGDCFAKSSWWSVTRYWIVHQFALMTFRMNGCH